MIGRLLRSLRTIALASLIFVVCFWDERPFPSSAMFTALAIGLAFLSLLTLPGPTITWRSLRPFWPYGAYLASVIVAAFIHAGTASTQEAQRQALFLATVGGVGIAASSDRPPAWTSLLLIGLALIVVQIMGPSSVVDSAGHTWHYRTIAQWGGYPEIGLLASMGAMGSFAIAVFARGVWPLRLASALLGAAFSAATFFLYSRSALVTVLALTPYLILLWIWRRFGRRPVIVGGLLMGLVLVGASVRWDLPDRIGSRLAGYEMTSRVAGWQSALSMMRANPWFGVGPGRYPEAHASRGTSYDHTHAYNIVLHAGAELGLVGLACYLLLWGRVLTVTARVADSGAEGMAAAAVHLMLLAFFVRSQSEHFLANLSTSFRSLMLLAILFGLAEAIARTRRRVALT